MHSHRIASRSCTLVVLGTSALAGAAQAAFLGVSGTNYEVVDGARRYSVIDVYADFSGAYDKLVNFYGTSSSTSQVRTALNGSFASGPAFAQAQVQGAAWLPTATEAVGAWDSFVTIGARDQSAAAALVQGDPYFVNAQTSPAGTIVGGSNLQQVFVGAGWYTSSPTGAHVYAGTYADRRIMLGRFSIETTELSASDTVTLQFKGNLTMRVNGSSAGTGTVSQPSVNQTFTYGFVPGPAGSALLAAATVLRRRRR